MSNLNLKKEHIRKATVTTAGFHEIVTSHCRLSIRPILFYPEINPKDFQAFVLPGGFHSQGFDEAYSSKIHHLAREIHQNGGGTSQQCVSGFCLLPMLAF